jgi:hypothetical protein
MMKLTPIHFILLSASLLSVMALKSVYAATDTTSVSLVIGQQEYVNMIGTAQGSSHNFSVNDIEPTGAVYPIVSLGTLGFESNNTGDCTLHISTANNFKLRHTVSNVKLTRYRLKYGGKNLSKLQPTKIFSCNTALSSLNFRAAGIFNPSPEAGVYNDVVTLTVTTQ